MPTPVPPRLPRRTRCRACAAPLVEVLSLGPIHLSDFPRSAGTVSHPPVPLDLVRCESQSCSLVQLAHTTPSDWMFKTYWYRSGVNEAMVAELADLVSQVQRRVPLHQGDAVVDIGANDGTLLAHYLQDLTTIAYEPAANLYEALRPHAKVLHPEYFHEVQPWALSTRAMVVTAVAMFYDLDDPHTFLEGITRILHPEGLFVVQQAYLPKMLTATAFDNICLPPGSPIITRCGLRSIEAVSPGTLVLTAAGSYHAVEQVHRREYTGDLVELTAYGFGYTLRVTPNHPVLVQRQEGDWRWIPAGDVQEGDAVCRPTPHTVDRPSHLQYSWGHGRGEYTLHTLPVTETFLEVAGYYLAEGSIGTGHNGASFYFGYSNEERQLAHRCRHLIERLGFTARLYPHASTTVVMTSGPLARLLHEHFGHGAGKKHLPPWAFALTVPESRVLIEAYMRGDGYQYRTTYWRGSTISNQLALDMAMLANRAGWHASICKQKAQAVAFPGRKKPSRPQPLWDILVQTKPQKRMKVWLDDEGRQCGRVRLIKRVPYSGPVYNLGVAVERTYVTPAMTVHNCHEHLAYHDLHSMEALLEPHGLEVVDVEERAINGGSFRTYIRFQGVEPQHVRVRTMRAYEQAFFKQRDHLYETFAYNVEHVRTQLQAILCAYQRSGGVVDLYAASTKANTLLQYCGVDATLIRQAWERSPEKLGRYVGVSGIPIVSEEEGRADPPSALLVGAWQFRDGFIAREEDYLETGGKLIFPLPHVDVVGGL